MRKKERQKMKKIITTSLITIVTIICLVGAFFFYASTPVRKERKEAIQLAGKYADMNKPERFYLFTRDQTYYTIAGENKKRQEILVSIPKDGDTIKVVDQKDGITEKQAQEIVQKKYHPYKIENINFGYIKGIPVWEVTTMNKDHTLSYYSLRFRNGSIYNKITNF